MSLLDTGKTSSPAPIQPTEPTSRIEITRHDVPLPHLPEALRGLTIVQISDFHRGCGGTDALIQEAVERANALSPDFMVVTGDFVDYDKQDVLPAAKLASSLRARRGVYAVLGNHDHRSDPILLASALEAGGIHVLHNRSVEVAKGLHFAGVDDILEGNPEIKGTLSRIPKNEAVVFLCHIPNGLDFVPKEMGLLLLAGHTHGGQIVLPFPTPLMVCRWHLHTGYVHGWYQRGAARMYVNRGIGVTGPRKLARRVNCMPEISVFRLQ